MARTKNSKPGGRKNYGPGGSSSIRNAYTRHPEIAKENEKLQEYYDTILGLSTQEKELFWTTLKRELPNSFRFRGSKGHALSVKRLLQTRYIPEITKISNFNDEPVSPPQAVPWYPDSLAWWMTTPKNVIRKFPPFAAFQRFLVSETNVGNISRQEVVSMIPPLLMDIRPEQTILDMCAAPGSKSAQILEMLHMGEEARIRKVARSLARDIKDGIKQENKEDELSTIGTNLGDDGRETGMFIANDSDYKRCHMLTHQLKRLSSPNLIVTNHDATIYPSLRVTNPDDPEKTSWLKFDRILVDVPCSGDGTLRKNVAIWKDWSPSNALGLHSTQIRILVRALSMLKPGGRVVYSTCSMNPLENEAVIQAAIDRCGGAERIEIVDCSNDLPLLKRAPGMKSWRIMDKSGRMWSSWKEVEECGKQLEKNTWQSRLADTMFPLPKGHENAHLPLDRCMRVYPHFQDTGGFFITVLHKKAEIKARTDPKNETKAGANGPKNKAKRAQDEDEERKDRKKVKTKDFENLDQAAQATKYVEMADSKQAVTEELESKSDTILAPEITSTENPAASTEKPAQSEKSIDTAIPEHTAENKPAKTGQSQAPGSEDSRPQPKRKGRFEESFKYLSTDHKVIETVTKCYGISERFPKNRFFVRNAMGEPAKGIYYSSSLVRDVLVNNEGRGIRFVHGGVKMFVKQDAPNTDVCRWRIQSEGMPILHDYVADKRVVVLKKKETLRKLLIEMFPRTDGDEWKKLDEVGARIMELAPGCNVLRVKPEGGDEEFVEEMALPLWKSMHSLNLMLPKVDRSAMLLRVFNDTTPLVHMGIDKKDRDAPPVKNEDVKPESEDELEVKPKKENEDEGKPKSDK